MTIVSAVDSRISPTAISGSVKNSWLKPARRLGHRLVGPIWGRPIRRFLLLTLIPTLAVFLYTAFWASPMYISTSMFAIKNLETNNAASGFDLAHIFGGAASGSTVGDSYLIAKYAHSWAILSKIDTAINIIAHFSDRQKDAISRLPRGATQEELLKYWAGVVTINFDPDTGIITCTVKAYTPEMAWRINQMIIEASEELVNDMNQRGRRDSLARAIEEVHRAETRLTAAHAEMRQMREKTAIIDPRSAAEALQTIIVNLEVEAAQVAAKLNETKAYMRPDSAAVETLQRRLVAINEQLAAERGKLSGLSSDTPPGLGHLSAIAGQFEDLLLEEEFARKQYTSALAVLESARAQSELKNRYLVDFDPPLLPDESLYPRVIRFTLLTFFGSGVIIAFLSLIVASIREHAGF